MNLSDTFLEHFETIKDPRLNNHNRRHDLMDILVIAILGTICGADGWNELTEFACAKKKWLKTFLSLPNGIPSHDTFARVFALIDPKDFNRSFSEWIESLSLNLNQEIIAVDGKTVRGSHQRKKGQGPIHLVSAWAAQHNLMLAQVKTADKSNEIEAIPRLLKMIDIKDSIVTIDAMGCQQKIANQIISQGADYILCLKENQPHLYEDVTSIFETAETRLFKKILNLRRIEKIKDHGRVETRRYTLISARDPLLFHLRWPGMNSLGILEVTRTMDNEVTRSKRFFITTIAYEKIDDFMRGVRKHWGIEINLHWSLDVSFKEDYSRVRAGHASENLATVRRVALNLLKQEKTNKRGITCKRKRCGWDNQYLMAVLKTGSGINDATF
jgi:predicted transposase YbfD/YdcC